MTRLQLIPMALIAASLLSPLAANAAQGGNTNDTRPGMGAFSGAGNLWGGSTRSAGATPGCVPGTQCGQHEHQQGAAQQQLSEKAGNNTQAGHGQPAR